MTNAFNLSQLANNTNSSGQITLTSGVTGTLPVTNGGTGAVTLTANSLLVGAGTSAVTGIAAGTSGNVLTSNGTTWASAAAAGIGVGQTWTNVTGSRALLTTYTNSTGKPIQLSIVCLGGSANDVELTVAGLLITSALYTNSAGGKVSLFAIVPVGASYSLGTSASTITRWSELR